MKDVGTQLQRAASESMPLLRSQLIGSTAETDKQGKETQVPYLCLWNSLYITTLTKGNILNLKCKEQKTSELVCTVLAICKFKFLTSSFFIVINILQPLSW